jgi:hypothetical protein
MADGSVVAFDIGVLLRFAWLDICIDPVKNCSTIHEHGTALPGATPNPRNRRLKTKVRKIFDTIDAFSA